MSGPDVCEHGNDSGKPCAECVGGTPREQLAQLVSDLAFAAFKQGEMAMRTVRVRDYEAAARDVERLKGELLVTVDRVSPASPEHEAATALRELVDVLGRELDMDAVSDDMGRAMLRAQECIGAPSVGGGSGRTSKNVGHPAPEADRVPAPPPCRACGGEGTVAVYRGQFQDADEIPCPECRVPAPRAGEAPTKPRHTDSCNKLRETLPNGEQLLFRKDECTCGAIAGGRAGEAAPEPTLREAAAAMGWNVEVINPWETVEAFQLYWEERLLIEREQARGAPDPRLTALEQDYAEAYAEYFGRHAWSKLPEDLRALIRAAERIVAVLASVPPAPDGPRSLRGSDEQGRTP